MFKYTRPTEGENEKELRNYEELDGCSFSACFFGGKKPIENPIFYDFVPKYLYEAQAEF
jgi:hypothetical protein